MVMGSLIDKKAKNSMETCTLKLVYDIVFEKGGSFVQYECWNKNKHVFLLLLNCLLLYCILYTDGLT